MESRSRVRTRDWKFLSGLSPIDNEPQTEFYLPSRRNIYIAARVFVVFILIIATNWNAANTQSTLEHEARLLRLLA